MRWFLKSSAYFIFIVANCGKSFAANGRVIAGKDAVPGAWPWQVKLTRRGRFMCGASLVSPLWVVTAAHCVSRLLRPTEYKVILGMSFCILAYLYL